MKNSNTVTAAQVITDNCGTLAELEAQLGIASKSEPIAPNTEINPYSHTVYGKVTTKDGNTWTVSIEDDCLYFPD